MRMDIDHAAHLGSALVAFCGPRDVIGALGIAAALFATGLFGSFAHCAPMCGPFVVAQLTDNGGGLRRLAAGALPGYHLGRCTTYVAFGATAGGTGASLAQFMQFRWVFAAFLAAAALGFVMQALRRLAPSLAIGIAPGPSQRWGMAVARMAAPLLWQASGSGVGFHGYRLGVVLGLLPCGFLYAALVAAAATGSALAGALAMASFALGTVPGLIALGVLGGAALRRWRGLANAVATPVFLLNAVTLGGLAVRMVA